MTSYRISFDDGDMTFPEEDLPAVAEAAHAVVREAEEDGVDVPSRDEALKWATKVAVACRCAQEVREFVPDSAP